MHGHAKGMLYVCIQYAYVFCIAELYIVYTLGRYGENAFVMVLFCKVMIFNARETTLKACLH